MKLLRFVVPMLLSAAAHANAVDALKDFVRDAKTGRASFTQVVTSPSGKKKTSLGSFEFARPNRFRFVYTKPFAQLILADGERIWIHDVELNQVSSRKLTQALSSTPAALLAGESLERDFALKALPERDGLAWVEALPLATDTAFQSVRVGFLGTKLVALEINDSFGQTSLLSLSDMAVNVRLAADRFRFVVPDGADLIEH